MQLEIITPDKKIYDGEIDFIQVPGKKGSFAVLKNHAPIISSLNAGKIKIYPKFKREVFIDIKGGIIEVKNNNIIVLADM